MAMYSAQVIVSAFLSLRLRAKSTLRCMSAFLVQHSMVYAQYSACNLVASLRRAGSLVSGFCGGRAYGTACSCLSDGRQEIYTAPCGAAQ